MACFWIAAYNVKMIVKLVLIILIAVPSWYFTDMDSSSRFLSYVLPIVSFFCLLAFCLWLIDLFEHIGQQRQKRQNSAE